MNNPDTAIIFPSRVIRALGDLRGPTWADFIAGFSSLQDFGLEQAALTLVVSRLASCTSCNSDSFRAMKGCTLCAKQSVKRFRGSDDELIGLYSDAYQDVREFMNTRDQEEIDRLTLEYLKAVFICR